MRTFKISCIVVLLVLAAVFIYQNTAVMQLNFMFWSVSMSACLMLLVVLFTGIIIGLLLSLLTARRKSRRATEGHINSFQ
jgi:lipopolysaccharide assembly protein A